jgi:FixJ family two-component response regulator
MLGLTHKGLFSRVSINRLPTASACDKLGTVASALSREYQPTCGAGRVQETSPTVLVIDDDPDLRDSLGILLRSAGLSTQLFESIPDFLRSKRPDGSACLVLDVRLPGASGLDFQRELAAANIKLPIIFITGYGDIPMSVQAMKGGAVEFLTKPFRQQELLDAIFLALAQDRAHQERERASSALKERLQALSSREREIMIQVAQGRLSKQIAGDLGISETTVNVHRSNLMRKMKAGSIAELGRMADQLNLIPDKPHTKPPLK